MKRPKRNFWKSSPSTSCSKARANPGSALGLALQTAITAAADQTLRDVIRLAVGKRDVISGWINRAGSLDGAIAELSQTLGISADETLDDVEAEFFSAALIPA